MGALYFILQLQLDGNKLGASPLLLALMGGKHFRSRRSHDAGECSGDEQEQQGSKEMMVVCDFDGDFTLDKTANCLPW